MSEDKSPNITVINTQPEHVAALAAMNRIIFPTLTEEELLTEAKYLKHLDLFPAGQFVAVLRDGDGETVVGATSTYRTDFDFNHIQHTFLEAVAGGWLTNHDPDGAWLYGADLGVQPDYRGQGIGRKLYNARRDLARRLNLRGEIAGGMIPGYDRYRDAYTVGQYVEQVSEGELHDPTLTMQLRNGFEVRGILYDHITDPRANDCATLIVRVNPDYEGGKT
jgi:GNAT superfamily N-acetyltransferase